MALFFMYDTKAPQRFIFLTKIESHCRWFIPMNVVLGSLSGSLIGFIVASLVRPPCPFLSLQ